VSIVYFKITPPHEPRRNHRFYCWRACLSRRCIATEITPLRLRIRCRCNVFTESSILPTRFRLSGVVSQYYDLPVCYLPVNIITVLITYSIVKETINNWCEVLKMAKRKRNILWNGMLWHPIEIQGHSTGTHCFHVKGRRVSQGRKEQEAGAVLADCSLLLSCLAYSSTLNILHYDPPKRRRVDFCRTIQFHIPVYIVLFIKYYMFYVYPVIKPQLNICTSVKQLKRRLRSSIFSSLYSEMPINVYEK
jgi:hypothetical protein